LKLLLDSHALVWAISEPEKLPSIVRDAIDDQTNQLFMSLATIWELGNKVAMGRLPALGTSVPRMIQDFLDIGVTTLQISQSDVVVASTLPPHHLDPFDRMLVAQAQANSLILVTIDRDIPKYDVQTMWS
jgi:PIN domain nuclease of toxin-antitoxin system